MAAGVAGAPRNADGVAGLGWRVNNCSLGCQPQCIIINYSYRQKETSQEGQPTMMLTLWSLRFQNWACSKSEAVMNIMNKPTRDSNPCKGNKFFVCKTLLRKRICFEPIWMCNDLYTLVWAPKLKGFGAWHCGSQRFSRGGRTSKTWKLWPKSCKRKARLCCGWRMYDPPSSTITCVCMCILYILCIDRDRDSDKDRDRYRYCIYYASCSMVMAPFGWATCSWTRGMAMGRERFCIHIYTWFWICLNIFIYVTLWYSSSFLSGWKIAISF